MKSTIQKLAVMILVSAGVTTSASAEERGYHGTLCNPSPSPSGSNLYYTFQGVEVTNLSSAQVMCGTATLLGANVERIEVTAHDRNSTSDLCCSMMVLNADGLPITSANRCTSGSANASQLLTAILPPNAASAVNLQCTIPAASPTGGPSRLLTYRVRSTP
jgi:hypothetical protein